MTFRPATAADVPAVLRLQSGYYADEGYPYDVKAAERALRQLIGDPSLGRFLVADASGEVAGYLAVTFGFSLEFGGRDGFVDELFIASHARGAGFGAQALAVAEEACREAGITALHLEVEHANVRARALYERNGYHEHSRHLMTKRF